MAVARTMPCPCQKCCRYIRCQRYSGRVGSSPSNNGVRSSIAPTTLRVCHSSVASPQPMRPGWSVTTLTKIQTKIERAFTFWLLSVWDFLPCFVCLVLFVFLVEYPVEHESTDTELLTQDRFLLSGWIDSIFIGSLHRVDFYT